MKSVSKFLEVLNIIDLTYFWDARYRYSKSLLVLNIIDLTYFWDSR